MGKSDRLKVLKLLSAQAAPRELKRALAVEMSIEGYSDRITVQLLGISTSFVRDWKKAFKVG